jgi:hypothetical protein
MKVIENHKQVASHCFNKVWDFLDSPERTREEEEQMVHLAHSSFWHWTQVEDHTPTNLSIGYWQISRVYAVIGNGEQALYYANRCEEISVNSGIPPFFIGYAYEAQSRAYKILGDDEKRQGCYEKACDYAEVVTDEESKKMLCKDLEDVMNSIAI